MKTLLHHIEQAKGHPHHIRKQIAYVIAGAGAGLVAFLWLGISLATDSFALSGPTSFGQGTSFAIDNASSGTQLAAVGSAIPIDDDRPRIEIVDAVMKSSPVQESEKTFIPF